MTNNQGHTGLTFEERVLVYIPAAKATKHTSLLDLFTALTELQSRVILE